MPPRNATSSTVSAARRTSGRGRPSFSSGCPSSECRVSGSPGDSTASSAKPASIAGGVVASGSAARIIGADAETVPAPPTQVLPAAVACNQRGGSARLFHPPGVAPRQSPEPPLRSLAASTGLIPSNAPASSAAVACRARARPDVGGLGRTQRLGDEAGACSERGCRITQRRHLVAAQSAVRAQPLQGRLRMAEGGGAETFDPGRIACQFRRRSRDRSPWQHAGGEAAAPRIDRQQLGGGGMVAEGRTRRDEPGRRRRRPPAGRLPHEVWRCGAPRGLDRPLSARKCGQLLRTISRNSSVTCPQPASSAGTRPDSARERPLGSRPRRSPRPSRGHSQSRAATEGRNDDLGFFQEARHKWAGSGRFQGLDEGRQQQHAFHGPRSQGGISALAATRPFEESASSSTRRAGGGGQDSPARRADLSTKTAAHLGVPARGVG